MRGMAGAGPTVRVRSTMTKKTLYNRFVRWAERGIWERIFSALAGGEDAPDRLFIDSTCIKVHRCAGALPWHRPQRGAATPSSAAMRKAGPSSSPDNGHGVERCIGHAARPNSLAASYDSPALAQAGHLGRGAGLIDDDEFFGIKIGLSVEPSLAASARRQAALARRRARSKMIMRRSRNPPDRRSDASRTRPVSPLGARRRSPP